MDRRRILAALALLPATRAVAQDDAPRPHLKISEGELGEAISARFPMRLGIPGLLDVLVSAPRLRLLPATNQIGALLRAQVRGREIQRLPPGEADFAFSLRIEPADQSVRAHDPVLLALRWPGLAPDAAMALQSLLPAAAQQGMGEVVVHRFSARELALPHAMGFEPDRITVAQDGLVISFGLPSPATPMR